MNVEQLWVVGIVIPFGAALILSVVLSRVVLGLARRHGWGQQVRDDGPQSHLMKQGTPSLGGMAMLAAILIVVAGVALISHTGFNYKVAVPLLLGLLFGALGFLDDFAKLRAGNTRGLKARWRILIEFVLAFGLMAWLVTMALPGPEGFPRVWGFSGLAVQNSSLELQIVWILLAGFLVVASANAVNLTDGVDGLASTLLGICALALAVVCFFRGMGDRTVLAAAISGAAIGFLWFNAHPAKIFMGDVGSLGLGALLGATAVSGGVEWFFGIAALVLIAEAASVILQVASFKLTGRRLFRMAPIHHAFEQRGWSEPLVVSRFALVGLLASLVGLALMLGFARGG